jgi:hypothetical protein
MMALVHRQHRRDEGDDYLALHRQGKLHAEIAYCHPLAVQIGSTLRGLVLIWVSWPRER